MAKSGSINFRDFERIQKNLEKLNQEQVDIFIDACAKELAARLLAKVIKRTPVGEYPNSPGKKGGTLYRGWTGEKKSSAVAYANSLTIHHFADAYVIEIINPVEYASYVEFGHRTRDHKGWVDGRFMLTISEQEIQQAAPAIIEKKLMKQMGELFS